MLRVRFRHELNYLRLRLCILPSFENCNHHFLKFSIILEHYFCSLIRIDSSGFVFVVFICTLILYVRQNYPTPQEKYYKTRPAYRVKFKLIQSTWSDSRIRIWRWNTICTSSWSFMTTSGHNWRRLKTGLFAELSLSPCFSRWSDSACLDLLEFPVLLTPSLGLDLLSLLDDDEDVEEWLRSLLVL